MGNGNVSVIEEIDVAVFTLSDGAELDPENETVG
jgi:hypothetical protein